MNWFLRVGVLGFLMVFAGCGTFLGKSKSAYRYDFNTIDAVIQKYEVEGVEPVRDEIGWFYESRSYCFAHHVPKYEGTRRSAVLISYIYEDDLYWGERCFGFAGIIGLPIGLVVDTVKYPFQFASSLSVSDSDIQNALRDKETARSLGFRGRVFPPIMLTPDFRMELEQLGYTGDEEPVVRE